MGVIPKVPTPRDPAAYVPGLERRMRGRSSVFGWRRRRAYAACVALIRYREDALDVLDREIAEAERVIATLRAPEDPSVIRGGAGCMIATYRQVFEPVELVSGDGERFIVPPPKPVGRGPLRTVG